MLGRVGAHHVLHQLVELLLSNAFFLGILLKVDVGDVLLLGAGDARLIDVQAVVIGGDVVPVDLGHLKVFAEVAGYLEFLFAHIHI